MNLSTASDGSRVNVGLWIIVAPSASGLYCVAYLPSSITADILEVTSIAIKVNFISSLTQTVSDPDAIPDPTADSTQVDPAGDDLS